MSMDRRIFLGRLFKATLAVAIADAAKALPIPQPKTGIGIYEQLSNDTPGIGMNPIKIRLNKKWFMWGDIITMNNNQYLLVADEGKNNTGRLHYISNDPSKERIINVILQHTEECLETRIQITCATITDRDT